MKLIKKKYYNKAKVPLRVFFCAHAMGRCFIAYANEKPFVFLVYFLFFYN